MADTQDLLKIIRTHMTHLGADEALTLDSDLVKLGLDSMASINLLLEIETAFGIVMPDEALTASAFATPADIAKFIPGLATA